MLRVQGGTHSNPINAKDTSKAETYYNKRHGAEKITKILIYLNFSRQSISELVAIIDHWEANALPIQTASARFRYTTGRQL